MQNWSDPRTTTAANPAVSVGVPRAARDAGLRSYMLSVYNYMASGVLLTGIVALLFAESGLAARVFTGGNILGWVIVFAPLLFIFAFRGAFERASTGTLKMMFFAYAATVGLSMSTVLLRYTGVSVAQTFFAVSAGFAALSLWGYTTKRDLSGWGSFLIVGVIGLVVAMLINVGIALVTGAPSSALQLAISAIGVLIFAGLTAYDTQTIKSMYSHVAGSDMMGKVVIMGALHLYLDFINMFTFLLQFLGDRR